MNCEAVIRVLGAWLDRELNRDEAEKVGGHLEHCAACLSEKARLERLHGSIKDILEKKASEVAFETIWHGVERRIRERKPWPGQLLDRGRALLRPRQLAWAIPAAAVLLIGVFSLADFYHKWAFRPNGTRMFRVESIDGHGLNMALFRESESRTLVIWLFQEQEENDESSEESTSNGLSS
jgi:hypothetical protein